MRVVLNGDAREVGAGCTLASLLAELLGSTKGVAAAVNEELVPRSLWSGARLRAGDRVEVLTASQGG